LLRGYPSNIKIFLYRFVGPAAVATPDRGRGGDNIIHAHFSHLDSCLRLRFSSRLANVLPQWSHFNPRRCFALSMKITSFFDCRFGERATHMPVRFREYIGGKHSQVRKVTTFIPNEVSVQNLMSQNRDG
jgi:hypothetical protein